MQQILRPLFFFAIIAQGSWALAQTTKIELLKTSFRTAETPGQRADAALAICSQSHSLNNDTLSYYASVAKKIALGLQDKNRELMADTYIENYLTRKDLFDSALDLCNADLARCSYASNSREYSGTMMQKCYCLSKANRNRAALDVSYSFLQETESHDDTLAQIYIKSIIGIVYRDMEQTELAMNWFEKADTTAVGPAYEPIKNELGIFFLLGMMYNWRLDATDVAVERFEDSSKAIYYLDRAIADSRRYGNLSILARTLNVKAATVGNKSHVEAEGKYVTEAARIYRELGDTISMLNSISPMCFYYIDEGHPEKGINACKEGIRIATRTNSFPILDLYEVLGQCYLAATDYPHYAGTLSSIIRIRDSLYKVNSEQDLAELNARYEDQKKENIIIRQKLDLTAKKYSILLISIATGILLVGLFLLYSYYTRKQKIMQQRSKREVVAAQENERKRISADLHDNIGAYAAAAVSAVGTIEGRDAQSSGRLVQLKTNIQDMIGQLNDSIWALNKKEVLLTAVSDRFKAFVQKLEPAYPDIVIHVEEDIQKDQVLTPFQALHLFRIMQEALNNALRHSGCTAVHAGIDSAGDGIRVTIDDNGRGMPTAVVGGNGIANVKMRARELGWGLEWTGINSGGTRMSICSGSGVYTTNSA